MRDQFLHMSAFDILLQAPPALPVLRPVESPTGNLMRGHGIAERIMLVYERTIKDLKAGEKVDLQLVNRTARIAKSFVSGCHEQCEERYLFSLLMEEGYLAGTVETLLRQHEIGREVTDRIVDLSMPGRIKDETHMNILLTLCRSYIFMYRPHISRENTELFPRLFEIAGEEKIREIGEKVRRTEQQSLGEKGFGGLLHELAEIEQSLGIGDVAGYTIGYG
jgi:hemerythrin-like domain-containing protein